MEKERENLNFQSRNNEKYNLPFKLSELKNSLDKSHDTTAGPDDIHYQILKHLPSDALETLLNIMNGIWRTEKNFHRTGIKQSLFLFPNRERIRRMLRIIDR